MNVLLKKLVIATIVSFCGITSNILAMQGLIANNMLAMQGLIANFYNKRNAEDKLKYSINLMWINEKLKKDQKGIHPSNDEFARVICEWAALNKDSVVNVWYDEEKTTDKAIKNSKKAIILECLQYPSKAPVVLRNVRSLSEVKEHPKVFSDHMPIYHTVDLLRPIAAHNDISQGEIDYFVYSDLDVKPMTKKQLFDRETKKNLKRYGMVMARVSPHDYGHGYDGSGHGYENSFQIISNQKPNLLEAQKAAIIDFNIKREDKRSEQTVYYSYPNMFKYFYHLEGCGDMKVRSIKNGLDLELYDKDVHGLKSFERHMFFYPHDTCCNGKDFRYGTFVPTKYVEAPPSRFSYLGKY